MSENATSVSNEDLKHAKASKLILIAVFIGLPWLFIGYYALVCVIPFLAGLGFAMVARKWFTESLVFRCIEFLVITTFFVAATSFLWWPLSILVGLALIMLGMPFCVGAAIPSEFFPEVRESQQCN